MLPPRTARPDSWLAELCAGFFEAACGERSWDDALAALACDLGAVSGILFVEAESGNAPKLLSLLGWNADAVALYAQHYHRIDLYALAARHERRAICRLGHELVDPAVMLCSEIWVDFAAKFLPAFHFIGIVMPLERERGGRLAFHRDRDGGAFDETDRATMEAVLPHLRRSLQLRDRLQPRDEALGPMLRAHLALPVLVLDGEGRVLSCNEAAARLADTGPLRLERLGALGCRLVATAHADAHRLARLLRRTADGGAGGGLLLGGATASDAPGRVAILLCRVPPGRSDACGLPAPGGAVLATVRAIDRPALPPLQRLCDLFGLTEAEASISLALAAGASAGEIASARGTSALTVRAQIRALLQKTGTPGLRHLASAVTAAADPLMWDERPAAGTATGKVKRARAAPFRNARVA